jgi:PDZ domain-containing secreted protein
VSEYLRARYPGTYDPANVTEPTDEDEEYQRRFEAMMQAANSIAHISANVDAENDSEESV